ncbi:hypothetical protein GPECTOR_566g598 [Gonium pectorale]|uniref:Uncharacterized protein n=1 Tax=Gonium pectorale TaxID=33097 RepID=A0A150FUI6_GONPE|nr:hypothetical protein GPECTOR_566g598 [Gonium pectorale]|eukprot:KXZ41303.1 hypothetical protein GPECTOR_566g598 [Gonium pectorale]
MSDPQPGTPSLDDIGSAHRHLQQAQGMFHKAKLLPGDPSSDVGRLEDDRPLREAVETGRQLKVEAIKDAEAAAAAGGGGGGGHADDRERHSDQHHHPGGGGLLIKAAHAVSSVVGNFSDSLATGIDSATAAVDARRHPHPPERAPHPEPPQHREERQQGGAAGGIGGGGGEGGEGGSGGGVYRIRDILGGSEGDTPYPGDMVDEPVQLEGGEEGGRQEAATAAAAAEEEEKKMGKGDEGDGVRGAGGFVWVRV